MVVRMGREFGPLLRCAADWEGRAVDPPVRYGFLAADEALLFRASRRHAAVGHPEARPGAFQAGLWRYDVAEFFLAPPGKGPYLEVNLSPNGAWWSCLFREPRVPLREVNEPLPGVEATSRSLGEGWEATVRLPWPALHATVGFGEGWRLNASFIIESPRQRFLSAHPLGPGEPDFHRPAFFPQVRLQDAGSPP